MAVTVTSVDPASVGTPVMAPVVALIDRPDGRPSAVHVRVADDWVSAPEELTVVMAEPVGVLLEEGPETDTVL